MSKNTTPNVRTIKVKTLLKLAFYLLFALFFFGVGIGWQQAGAAAASKHEQNIIKRFVATTSTTQLKDLALDPNDPTN